MIDNQYFYDLDPELRKYPHSVHYDPFGAATILELKGNYSILKSGDMCIYLDCPDHIILKEDVVNWLQDNSCIGINPKPIKIILRGTGQIWSSEYFDLNPTEEITPESISRYINTTNRAWHYNHGNLFVSYDIWDKLKEIKEWNLAGRPGFSGYCA
ncbi:MAG: hypothetical protein WAX69_06345 [Victivallales bacterium]